MKRLIFGIILACIGSMFAVQGLLYIPRPHDFIWALGMVCAIIAGIFYLIAGLLIYFGVRAIKSIKNSQTAKTKGDKDGMG